MIKLNNFSNCQFGTLTTLTNDKTGLVMFIAAEIGRMWGHKNLKQVIKRLLNANEYKVIKKSEYSEFFQFLVSNKLLPTKAQRIQLITESGVYKLALSSNLEKAKMFRDWVTGEILPSIKHTGYYSIADQTSTIMLHTDVAIQKMNSKDINRVNYIDKGIDAVIEYNRMNCLLHTGKLPHEIKQIGKEAGLNSTETSSAKEVLRHINPAVACAMSFTDSLVKKGFDLKTISELSKQSAIPLFEAMIKIGINPIDYKI